MKKIKLKLISDFGSSDTNIERFKMFEIKGGLASACGSSVNQTLECTNPKRDSDKQAYCGAYTK